MEIHTADPAYQGQVHIDNRKPEEGKVKKTDQINDIVSNSL